VSTGASARHGIRASSSIFPDNIGHESFFEYICNKFSEFFPRFLIGIGIISQRQIKFLTVHIRTRIGKAVHCSGIDNEFVIGAGDRAAAGMKKIDPPAVSQQRGDR
jgi:hypothetical protein